MGDGPLVFKDWLIFKKMNIKLAIINKDAYYAPSINSRRKLAGGFLSVGIILLLNAIILQFVTLKYFERRMIL